LWVRRGEFDAAGFVHSLSGREVEIGERDSPRYLIRKNPKCFAEDGIILHFHLVAVAVYEEGGRRLFFRRRGRLSRRRAAEVSLRLILTHHFNFRCQVSHLRRELRVLLRFGSRRARLVRLVPCRWDPIRKDRLVTQGGTPRKILAAIIGTRKGRVEQT